MIAFAEMLREEVNKYAGNRNRIAAECGVSAGWMSRFSSGQIKDPGVSKMTRLADVLGLTVIVKRTGTWSPRRK